MKHKDNMEFLDLFGDIREEYICDALEPWNSSKKHFSLRFGQKVACLVCILTLGVCALFHSQVQAAIETITTVIGNFLHLSEDISSYTEIINTTQEKDGVAITLQEVITSEDSLMIAFHTEPGKGKTCALNFDQVLIDGEEQELSSVQSASQSQEPDTDLERIEFVRTLDLDEPRDITLKLTVSVTEMPDDLEDFDPADSWTEVPFIFQFRASAKELSGDTMTVSVDREIAVDENAKLKLDTLTVSKVFSEITAHCDNLPLDQYDYYLFGTDSMGNEVTYGPAVVEDGICIFRNESTFTSSMPSTECEWIELQLYRQTMNYTTVDSDSDGEEMAEVSDAADTSPDTMTAIGEKIRISLKQ